jgi:HEAT repeat protein/Ca2+-binding EF-hand superfamily protein
MPEFDSLAESRDLDVVELEDVKKLVQLLNNTLKSLLLYPANNPLPKEFKRKLHLGLTEFLDEHDELKLDVEASRLVYEGAVVYEEGAKEEGLVHLLHQDGVRELAFVKGLEAFEIDDFLEVMELCLKSRDLEEDLVTMLWEKDLNNVKYLVVDDLLDVDVPAAEDIPDNWAFDKLYHSEVGFFDQEAESLGEGAEDQLSRYQQKYTRELLRKLKEFSPDEVESIQRLLDMDNQTRSLDEFLDVLTEVLIAEKDPVEFDRMMEAMARVSDALVTVTDFSSAANIIRRLEILGNQMGESSHQTDPFSQGKAEIIARVIDQAGGQERISRISQILNEKEGLDLNLVQRYLLALSRNSITPMIHMLRDIKEFNVRRMVCEVLAQKAKGNPELLREGLSDRLWYVVRNVVSVIGLIGSEEGVRLLKPVAKHRDLRVRKEIVSSLLKIPGRQAGELMVGFLKDEDKRVRLLASRGLARRREESAVPVLLEILRDDGFRESSPDEKKSMLESFAVIAQEQAIPLLVRMITRRSLLKRDKHNETRIFAIGALSLIHAPKAVESLGQLSRKRNRVIRQACEAALRRREIRQARADQSEAATKEMP